MLNTRKVTPGQKGTKKLQAQYGDRLLCVRYRYDREQRRRYKTVELIVEEAKWTPPSAPFAANAIVGLRIEFKETDLQHRIKEAGGKWIPARKLWELRYDQAVHLGLKSRIEKPKVSDNTNLEVSDNRNSFCYQKQVSVMRNLNLPPNYMLRFFAALNFSLEKFVLRKKSQHSLEPTLFKRLVSRCRRRAAQLHI